MPSIKHLPIDLHETNNNVENRHPNSTINLTQRKFVERRLTVDGRNFLILPNGGTGDCMFKAVSQAIFRGDERKHAELRRKIVEFIVSERWNKFKESIEVQHAQGNQALLNDWKNDAMKAYTEYMTTLGTLGSSSELNAAGELFGYNYVTIQEYAGNKGTVYRVENCCHLVEPGTPVHHFLFTGDYDNGHWEYLQPFQSTQFSLNSDIEPFFVDGMLPGSISTHIDGVECKIDKWLKVHTENTNDSFRLKHNMSLRIPSKASLNPFEWDAFEYEENGTVSLINELYKIRRTTCTDLFTVLSTIMFEDKTNDKFVNRLESKLLDYRIEKFSVINEKLITQPFSHGFTLKHLKYLSMPCKGNVQDLLSAADIYGFSFQVFIKPSKNSPVQACRFVHVDRLGAENDKMEHFFMRNICLHEQNEEIMAKWWHLSPFDRERDEKRSYTHVKSETGDSYRRVKEDKNNNVVESERDNADNGESPSTLHPNPDIPEALDPALEHELISLQNEEGPSPNDSLSRTSRRNKKLIIEQQTNNLFLGKSDIGEFRTSESSHHESYKSQTILKPSSTKVITPPCADGTATEAQMTVIEVYDAESKAKTKYICNGLIPEDKVLDALFDQGYLQRNSVGNFRKFPNRYRIKSKSYPLSMILNQETNLQDEQDVGESITRNRLLEENSVTKIKRGTKAIGIAQKNVESYRNRSDFRTRIDIPMDYVVRSEYRNDTASNIALIANDSVERYGKHLTESRGKLSEDIKPKPIKSRRSKSMWSSCFGSCLGCTGLFKSVKTAHA